jgi:hypothetical protein
MIEDPESQGKPRVWSGRENRSADAANTSFETWIDFALFWVAVLYLLFGALALIFAGGSLMGLIDTDRDAGRLFGFGMAGFFLGGVLTLLIRIDQKLSRILENRS